jgi:hypothetical protein
MTENFRHHRACSREIVFVAVPVPAAGSPAPLYRVKPPAYKRNSPEPWRPRTKLGKAERVVEFIRRAQNQDSEVRAFLDAARAASHRCDEMIPSG